MDEIRRKLELIKKIQNDKADLTTKKMKGGKKFKKTGKFLEDHKKTNI